MCLSLLRSVRLPDHRGHWLHSIWLKTERWNLYFYVDLMFVRLGVCLSVKLAVSQSVSQRVSVARNTIIDSFPTWFDFVAIFTCFQVLPHFCWFWCRFLFRSPTTDAVVSPACIQTATPGKKRIIKFIGFFYCCWFLLTVQPERMNGVLKCSKWQQTKNEINSNTNSMWH